MLCGAVQRRSARDRCLSQALLDLIAGQGVGVVSRWYHRRDFVYAAGSEPKGAFIIVSGFVKTVTHSISGKDCLQQICGPGDIFGLLPTMVPDHSESSIALTDSYVHFVPAGELQGQSLASRLSAYFAQQVACLQESVMLYVTLDCSQRLAHILISMARRHGRPVLGGYEIEPCISQEDFAAMVGTTRTRIGAFLKSFETMGALDCVRGRVHLVRPDLLDEHLTSSLNG